MATQFNRPGYQAQMDVIFADNTNEDIDATDLRNAAKDLAESSAILTSINIFSEDNVFGEIDHVSVFGATGVPGYSNTNEIKPRTHILSATEHMIRLENSDNVDADVEAWSMGQQDAGELLFQRIKDASGTYTYNTWLSVDQFNIASFACISIGDPTELTVTSDAITPTLSFHSLGTEGGAGTDDLDTITGRVNGQWLVLKSNDSDEDVTLKDAIGNLQLAGDFTLSHFHDTITLIFLSSFWYEISRSDNA